MNSGELKELGIGIEQSEAKNPRIERSPRIKNRSFELRVTGREL